MAAGIRATMRPKGTRGRYICLGAASVGAAQPLARGLLGVADLVFAHLFGHFLTQEPGLFHAARSSEIEPLVRFDEIHADPFAE